MKIFLSALLITFLVVGSIDAQVSFSSLPGPNGGGIGDIAINSSGNIFVYAAQSYGGSKPIAGSVYRSTNNGTNWTKLSTGTNGLNDLDAYDIYIDASDNIYVLGKNNIYKSTAASNGDAWTSFTPPAPFSSGEAIIKTDDGDLFIVHTFDGVLRSTDDGATWNIVSNNLPSPSNYASIIGVGNDVYVGVLNDGTYKATNPSSNSPVWNTFNSGLSLPDQPASLMLKGTTLYQSNRNGAFYFNGATWVQIAQDFDNTAATYIPENFNNSDHAIVNGPGTRLYFIFNNGRVYYSDNSTGGPWSSIADLELGDNIYSLAAFTSSVFVGYGRQGIMRSTNSGSTWGYSDTGIFFTPSSSIVQAGNNKLIVADGGPRLHTSFSGFSWSKEAIDPACPACGISTLIKLSNGNILGISNETFLSLAADNGTNWSDIGGPPVYLQQVVTGDETVFFGYQYGYPTSTFYRSIDQAVSFNSLALIGLPATYETRRIAADASNNLYIFLYNYSNGKGEVYKVDIPSLTATKITNTTLTDGIDNIRNLGSTIYLLGRNSFGNRRIVKTVDGGLNWTGTNVIDMYDFAVLSPDVFIGVDRFGNINDYYYSNNGGIDWEWAFQEAYETQIVGGIIDADGYAYISVANAPMYKSDNPIIRPDTPANLQAIGTGENSVTLEWDHNQLYVEKFLVQRKLQSDITFTTIDTLYTNDLYYEDSGLIKNTAYVYRVVAMSEAGSNTSAELSVTTKDDCTLTIPDNQSWTGAVPGGFTNAEIGIRKFNNDLYLITDITAGSLETVPQNGGGQYGQTTVETYFYENCGQPFIQGSSSVYPNGNGTWNGTTTITLNFQIDKDRYTQTEKTITLTLNTNDPAPNPPANLIGYVYDNTSTKLEWLADFYHSQYTIHRSTAPGFTPAPGNQIGTVNYPTVTFTDNGPLVLGATYYYQVIAKNDNSTPLSSSASNEASVVFAKPKFILSSTVVSSTKASAPTAAWADFNNDGFEDLLMPPLDNTLGEPLLFQNTGTDFQLLTSKLPAGQPYIGPSIGDYDNDGLIDVFMSAISLDGDIAVSKYSLFKNTGNFTFSEQTTPALSQAESEGAFSSSWVDFNNDSKLDVFVANQNIGKQALYQGDGAGGFTKIITGPLATDNFTNSYASWSDFDKNGYQDILITASEDVNSVYDAFRLFTNTNGTFTKITGSTLDSDDGKRIFTHSWGDYDNDLDMDLFAPDQQGGPGLLFKNNGNGTFTKAATVAGSPTETPPVNARPFSSSWGDIDNDGDLDLVIANGFLAASALFINQGSGNFTKVTGEVLTASPGFHLSASFADYDRNGFLDLLVGQLVFAENGPVGELPNIKLFKNNNTTGNWIQIKLVGTISNKSAIGARIVVTTGATTQMREITSHTGFGSQNSLIAHFGLGAASTINSIQVTWPSGAVQTISNESVNKIMTITEDGTGPIITARLPVNGAAAASITTQIAVDLNEASTAVASKKLNIYLATNLAVPVFSLDVTGAAKTALSPGPGDRYTFSLPGGQKLQANTDYVITIDAGAFEDVYGNDFLGVAQGSWTFKTATNPIVTILSPLHNATNVAASTSLSLTFDKPVAGVATKTVKLFKSTDAINATHTINATTGTVSGNTVTFTVTPKLERLATYNVVIDAGAFTATDHGTEYAGLTSGNWTFITNPGPAVSLVSPAPNATNIAVNTSLEITFDKTVTAVAGKKIKVLNGANTLLDLDVSTNGTIATNKYTLPAPAGNWPFLTQLQVIVDAGAFVDSGQNDFAGIGSSSWTFTTVEAPDVTAPTISFTAQASIAKGSANLDLPITVTDAKTVTQVQVSARKITDTNYVTINATAGTGTTWNASLIQATHFDAIGTEYYITATDNSGNSSRSPVGTDTYKTYLTYGTADTKIPSDKLGFGGQIANWKVFSIPFELGTNNSVTSVFDELNSLTNKVDYRLITYQNQTAWAEFPGGFSTFQRGKGYFINIKNALDIIVGTNLTVPSNSRSNLFQINLIQGWNMIGNPYLTAISWDNVATYNSLSGTVATLKKFSSGQYSASASLAAFEGGFVFAAAPVTISIPFLNQTTPGGRKGFEDLSPDINEPEWALPLKLTQDELSYDLSSVGMALDASAGFDDYDDITPPRFLDYLEMNFSHPEFFAKYFTRDVVPSQSSFTWEFTVDSNLDGQAELTWDNSPFSGGAKEIYLLDISRQKLINMKETGSYSFNTKESGIFKVYFGENLRIAPDKVQLGKAYPNPTSGYTLMAFSLPESGGLDQFVTLDVVDAIGKEIGTISQGRFNPGYHEVSWNAKELNNGFYTYRLTVQGKQGRTIHVNKLIIK